MSDTTPKTGNAKLGVRVVPPLLLGVLLGALVTDVLTTGPATRWVTARLSSAPAPLSPDERALWAPPEFQAQCDWRYLRVDEDGWFTGRVGRYEDLNERLSRPDDRRREIVIPIFPTVYAPTIADKLYYDFVLASDITPGDKVLVIGTGSGADAWTAWLRSQAPVYVVEINPMAVVNARVTARLAGFPIRAMTGDVTQVELPDDFAGFDYVLWNMPFLEPADLLAGRNFHDGDNGRLLRGFLDRLPALLKPDGKAIVLNVAAAQEMIDTPGVVAVRGTRKMPPPAVDEAGGIDPDRDFDRDFMLFVIPRP